MHPREKFTKFWAYVKTGPKSFFGRPTFLVGSSGFLAICLTQRPNGPKYDEKCFSAGEQHFSSYFG